MAQFGARLGLTRYDADEHYRLALDAYSKKNMEEALSQIGHALRLYPSHAEYHAAEGFFYLEHGAREKAADSFARALTINPYELMAQYGLGLLAYKGQDWAAALEHLSLAHIIDPRRLEVLYLLAIVQKINNLHEAARASMTQAAARYEALPEMRKQARDARAWLMVWDTPVQMTLPRE